MNKAEFNKFSLKEKADLCWSMCDYVNWVHHNEYKVMLFIVDAFHVEMYFNPQAKNIDSIEILQIRERLNHYTYSVDITDAFNK